MLTAVVISIGVTVWSMAHATSSIMATDYFREVGRDVDALKERVDIECARVQEGTPSKLQIWVYNYGQIDINMTLIVLSSSDKSHYFQPNSGHGVLVHGGALVSFPPIDPTEFMISKGTGISIVVYTERGNKAYASIYA